MRGRKPIPTALKILQGNRGKRPPPPHEPTIPPPVQSSAPPAELTDPVAQAEWMRLEPLLCASKIITQGDRGALLALCQQWARYLEANGKVATAGMVVLAPSGNPIQNPYIQIANKSLMMCVRLWIELGLTPSSRSRVTTTGEDPTATLEKFLHEA